MSFDVQNDTILPVDHFNLRLDPSPHPFESENIAAVEEQWRHESAANTALFDGRVVLLSHLAYRQRRFEGLCHEVRFATFLLWRKLRPIATARHIYAHAMLVTRDGALLAIRMGGHTATAGKVYFAAGSFEPAVDFKEGRADFDHNMIREVFEETGFDIAATRAERQLQALSREDGTVVFRRFFLEETAEAAAEKVRAHIAQDPDPEIEEPVIIRSAETMPKRIAPHMPALIEWHFANPPGM